MKSANATQEIASALGNFVPGTGGPVLAAGEPTYSCTGLVYFQTDEFVEQTRRAVNIVLGMNLVAGGRVHVKFVDWVRLSGPAPMGTGGNYNDVYLASYPMYSSKAHCVVLVESPPIPDPQSSFTILGVASVCGYCSGPNVAFVTNNNDDDLTHVTIAHEIGHLLCGTHASDGVMKSTIGGENNANYDVFSEESVAEISTELANSNYGAPECMAQINDTLVSPHSKYFCDEHGVCYRDDDHEHADSTAFVFLGLLFVYFIFMWLLLVF